MPGRVTSGLFLTSGRRNKSKNGHSLNVASGRANGCNL